MSGCRLVLLMREKCNTELLQAVWQMDLSVCVMKSITAADEGGILHANLALIPMLIKLQVSLSERSLSLQVAKCMEQQYWCMCT